MAKLAPGFEQAGKAPALSVSIEGYQEIREMFHKLGDKVVKKVVGKALRAAGAPIRKEARENLKRNGSVVTEQLWRTMQVKLVRQKSTQTRLLVVGAKNKTVTIKGKRVNPAKYSHLVEFGTQIHPIVAKGGWLNFGGGFKTVVKKVTHPGAEAKPFIRPAYDTKKGEAKTKFEQKLELELTKELNAAKRETHRWPPTHIFGKF